ncbi:MAG TPA: hypothetical protein VG273_26015 [Bryobacteraceae bacterium]|jgi:hypothetical protein|nr:hypothetical protein [Bryobacteraceae bacterium]
MKSGLVLFIGLAALLHAGDTGSRVEYTGGTIAGLHPKTSVRLQVREDDVLDVTAKEISFQIPYKDINTLEYGLKVSRRYLEAALISPMFLIAKKKTHFLSIGYVDAEGHQQAMVLQVGSGDIRPLLVSLEARTGRKVEYQDEEARKAGKG